MLSPFVLFSQYYIKQDFDSTSGDFGGFDSTYTYYYGEDSVNFYRINYRSSIFFEFEGDIQNRLWQIGTPQ